MSRESNESKKTNDPKKSSVTNFTWTDSLLVLNQNRSNKTIEILSSCGIKQIIDLLWLTPTKINLVPPVKSFELMIEEEIFRGKATIVSVDARPNFRIKGKGNVPLYTIRCKVRDLLSSQYLTLVWFNTYPSTAKKLKSMNDIEFFGTISSFNNQFQINNPTYKEIALTEKSEDAWVHEVQVKYPAIQGLQSRNITQLIQKIPNSLWQNIPTGIPLLTVKNRKLLTIEEAFKIKHGLIKEKLEKSYQDLATRTLAYYEFCLEQLKIKLRREKIKRLSGHLMPISKKNYQKYLQIFPYQLTDDQEKATQEILQDLVSGNPMMRLIQGDVGCGKTSVALLACMVACENKFQAVFMCPTEALAQQHYQSLSELLKNHPIQLALIIGSTKAKEKRFLIEQISQGEIDLIIGTHSLIQNAMTYKNLGLLIIDEQHKFGVNQRLKLIEKAKVSKNGTTFEAHCLIMSATPIPRSLSLTQYGDLDITTIKSLPKNRKGIKTKIITPALFEKFLSFLQTRITMGEQAYIVVPAIEESEVLDVQNVEEVFSRFKKFFPKLTIAALHGKMKSEEKENILNDFHQKKIHLLISTTVIEVGINVINSTIMAIMNPERFGLSSLHQLRGRVGRGEKAGFCFLITEKVQSAEVMKRLRIIETETDGFKIAEADLEIRGEGNLFGAEQSGSLTDRKVGNIITHSEQLYWAKDDISHLIEQNDPMIRATMTNLAKDTSIFATI
jgi:ATP-dependent DNA helicase RecG